MKKGQIHLTYSVRKEQIIRETLYLEESGEKFISAQKIGKQIRLNPTSTKEILRFIVDENLITVTDGKNRMNHPTNIYNVNRDIVKQVYGEMWYINVMSGIKRRLNK